MNGLFFGNTATSGGVDPRYPKFLMDTIIMKYNAINYIQLADLVSDDSTPFNGMKYTFSSSEVKASIKSRKQLFLFTSDPYLESDILTMTATDLDGFSTTQDILLIITDGYHTYSPTSFNGNGNCSFDIMTLYPDLQSNFFDDTIYLVNSPYQNFRKNSINLNLKLNGTTVEIRPKLSGTLTGYIYIANPTIHKLLTIEYTINN